MKNEEDDRYEHKEEAGQDCLEDKDEEEDHKIRIMKSNAMILTTTNYYTGGEDEAQDNNYLKGGNEINFE